MGQQTDATGHRTRGTSLWLDTDFHYEGHHAIIIQEDKCVGIQEDVGE